MPRWKQDHFGAKAIYTPCLHEQHVYETCSQGSASIRSENISFSLPLFLQLEGIMWIGMLWDPTNGEMIWKRCYRFQLWRYISMILVTSTYGYLIGNHSSTGMTSWNVPLPKTSIPQCLDKQMRALPTACGQQKARMERHRARSQSLRTPSHYLYHKPFPVMPVKTEVLSGQRKCLKCNILNYRCQQ